MLKQTSTIVSFLLISILVGIAATLVTDKIENITVQKRLEKTLESDIRNALSSFKESAKHTTPLDEKTFVLKFISATMEDKVTVYERVSAERPKAGSDESFLFTLSDPGYMLDIFIRKEYLRSELAILDVPEYISGITATIVVFTFIVLYTENRKRTLSLQQKMERKHAELDSALKQHEALALLGRMSAALAHELKTPIATISNLIQTFPSRRSDEQFVNRFLALTRDELNRTQQLIDNLLAYGKEIDIRNNEWVPVKALVEKGASDGIAVHVQANMKVYGDAFYLDLLFKNLLRNSREAGAANVSVQVPAHSGGRETVGEIVVDDDGAGFSPASDVEKLTDPFVTSRSRGGGLGLYLARKIVAAHGGTLVLARRAKGARVVIRLPAKRISV